MKRLVGVRLPFAVFPELVIVEGMLLRVVLRLRDRVRTIKEKSHNFLEYFLPDVHGPGGRDRSAPTNPLRPL